jgi:Fic-DOC domain mobile mystery protein B
MTSPDRREASPVRRGTFAVGAHVAGATPVDPDEAADLIPAGIETADQLNAFEQLNILSATEWALRHRPRLTPSTVLSDRFLFDLHRRMFDATWRWAGEPRRTDKNIGVHWPTIRVGLRDRVKDAQLWLAESVFPLDEVAVRLHHGIVLVHPFPNGNGRWSRLVADALLHAHRQPPFSWGAQDLTSAGEARAAYLAALRAADRGDVAPILSFARS